MDNERRANQLKFWNVVLTTLDKKVTSGKVEQFARIVDGHNLFELAFPMYYKVWMLCLLGKFYVLLGQYEKGERQIHAALLIWEGPAGYKEYNFNGINERAKKKHDVMIGGVSRLCTLGLFLYPSVVAIFVGLTHFDLRNARQARSEG